MSSLEKVIMDDVVREVFKKMLDKAEHSPSHPIDIIRVGVQALNSKDISNNLKRDILTYALDEIANGQDGIAGTADDRLSPETVKII